MANSHRSNTRLLLSLTPPFRWAGYGLTLSWLVLIQRHEIRWQTLLLVSVNPSNDCLQQGLLSCICTTLCNLLLCMTPWDYALCPHKTHFFGKPCCCPWAGHLSSSVQTNQSPELLSSHLIHVLSLLPSTWASKDRSAISSVVPGK